MTQSGVFRLGYPKQISTQTANKQVSPAEIRAINPAVHLLHTQFRNRLISFVDEKIYVCQDDRSKIRLPSFADP